MSKWIKKGDKVVVIAGNDRGKTGEVVARQGERVIVQGINIRKKHAKRRAKTGAGEIHEIEMAIHISNVSLCDAEGKAVKAKVRISGKSKELYYTQGGSEVTLRQVRKS
ncbi:MAG TPA: 50S ribosomal protein L24 [Rhabdochlamydiaceae bacterium]|jgi:large subunit ribosomal protein L24